MHLYVTDTPPRRHPSFKLFLLHLVSLIHTLLYCHHLCTHTSLSLHLILMHFYFSSYPSAGVCSLRLQTVYLHDPFVWLISSTNPRTAFYNTYVVSITTRASQYCITSTASLVSSSSSPTSKHHINSSLSASSLSPTQLLNHITFYITFLYHHYLSSISFPISHSFRHSVSYAFTNILLRSPEFHLSITTCYFKSLWPLWLLFTPSSFFLLSPPPYFCPSFPSFRSFAPAPLPSGHLFSRN